MRGRCPSLKETVANESSIALLTEWQSTATFTVKGRGPARQRRGGPLSYTP